jgi:hypothetical protein
VFQPLDRFERLERRELFISLLVWCI